MDNGGTLNAVQWIQVFVLGAFAGAVGQLVRSIAGVARQNRQASEAATTGQPPPPGYQVSTLVTSLIIGAVAGIIAAGVMNQSLFPAGEAGISLQTVLGIAAAGYTGADFIEGVAGKYFPQAGPPSLTPDQLKSMRDEVTKLVTAAAASGAQAGAQAGAAAGAQTGAATGAQAGAQTGAQTGAAAANVAQAAAQEPAVG